MSKSTRIDLTLEDAKASGRYHDCERCLLSTALRRHYRVTTGLPNVVSTYFTSARVWPDKYFKISPAQERRLRKAYGNRNHKSRADRGPVLKTFKPFSLILKEKSV